MILLALDPGLSTGYGWFRLTDDAPLEHLEHGTIPDGLRGLIAWWRHRDQQPALIVCESFQLDGRTPKPETMPLRIEGAISALFDGPIVFQQNSYKATAPDDLLRRIGWWWPGEGHAIDAARHAIAYARKRQHRPTIEAWWPRREETPDPL